MKYIYKFTYLVIILLLIGVSINFVYAQPSTSYVISIHTDAYTKNKYEGGAHVIGSGNFANRLQAGLSTSADKYKVFKKQGVGQTAVDDGNATLKVARRAGVTNAALIEVGAHSLLLDQYGTPSGVASSQYVDNLISNVIGPNVSGSGKIIIPMDHTRKRIPDKTGGNTYEGSNQTGAAPYNGYVERDVTDTIAAKIKAKFGDRVVIIKPEDYNSYQEYDAAIVRAVGGTATTDPSTSSAPSTATPTTTAGTVSYQSYTNFPGVGRISSLCQLITALWLLGFAVLLTSVLGMFLYGGYMYVTAGVNAGKVNQAKEIFTNTLTGLIIGLSIFIIINIINPGLLQGNCSIPSVGSGETIGGPPGPSNIIPKPGESVFPTNCSYERPKGGQLFGAPRTNPDGSYRPHAGIDFTPPDSISNSQALQCSILAFRDGTVNESSYGYLGIIHADGVKTRYVHNSKNFVKVGDKVQAGQEIGKMGNVDTGPIHLHFEIYINGAAVNPANVLLDGSANPDPSKVKTTGSPRAQ